ncbi:hypothetical protein MD484_g5188, partial [Candolleomyces efflorescens]
MDTTDTDAANASTDYDDMGLSVHQVAFARQMKKSAFPSLVQYGSSDEEPTNAQEAPALSNVPKVAAQSAQPSEYVFPDVPPAPEFDMEGIINETVDSLNQALAQSTDVVVEEDVLIRKRGREQLSPNPAPSNSSFIVGKKKKHSIFGRKVDTSEGVNGLKRESRGIPAVFLAPKQPSRTRDESMEPKKLASSSRESQIRGEKVQYSKRRHGPRPAFVPFSRRLTITGSSHLIPSQPLTMSTARRNDTRILVSYGQIGDPDFKWPQQLFTLERGTFPRPSGFDLTPEEKEFAATMSFYVDQVKHRQEEVLFLSHIYGYIFSRWPSEVGENFAHYQRMRKEYFRRRILFYHEAIEMVTPSLEWETLLAFPRATFRENAQVLLKRSHDLELERKNPLRWPHPSIVAPLVDLRVPEPYVAPQQDDGPPETPRPATRVIPLEPLDVPGRLVSLGQINEEARAQEDLARRSTHLHSPFATRL